MRTRDLNIQQRGRLLVGIAARNLPRDFVVTSDADAWPLIGSSLLSRMTTTLGSILDLQSREQAVDAGILLRSLYEHAVHLAWLAVDPSAARIEGWRKDDLIRRLKADADVRGRGIALFTDDVRTQLQASVDAMQGDPLILTNLATAADAWWAGKLPGLGPQTEPASFRGLYAVLYRDYSGVAHPSFRGLNPVVEDLSPIHRRVRLESRYEGHGPYGMATVIFALALYVASDTLGWPQASEITGAFEQHP